MTAPSVNPPARFPNRPIDQAEFKWWIAKVKPRMEKALASDFLKRNIEYYLPMYTKVTRRKDNNKPRKSVLTLFGGYIAFALEVPENIFVTGRVVNLVEIKNQKRFIYELGQIYQALENGAVVEPFTEAIPVGTPVEVFKGPLRGITGVVDKLHGGGKLILTVEALGRASIAVEGNTVRPVSNA